MRGAQRTYARDEFPIISSDSARQRFGISPKCQNLDARAVFLYEAFLALVGPTEMGAEPGPQAGPLLRWEKQEGTG